MLLFTGKLVKLLGFLSYNGTVTVTIFFLNALKLNKKNYEDLCSLKLITDCVQSCKDFIQTVCTQSLVLRALRAPTDVH